MGYDLIEQYYLFLTLVMNLETGAIVYVGDGRQEDALKPFWKRIKRSGSRIIAVAADRSRPYTKGDTRESS